MVKVDIILHPDLLVKDAHEIARKIRCTVEEVPSVGVRHTCMHCFRLCVSKRYQQLVCGIQACIVSAYVCLNMYMYIYIYIHIPGYIYTHTLLVSLSLCPLPSASCPPLPRTPSSAPCCPRSLTRSPRSLTRSACLAPSFTPGMSNCSRDRCGFGAI